MNAEKYQKEILHDMHIVESVWFSQNQLSYLVPPHRAKSTVSFLKNKNVNVLPWPGNSPDLNPVKILWSVLKRQLTPMK